MKNHTHLKPFFIASLLVFTFMLNAQPFNSINTGIIDAGWSAVAWADYDNDGEGVFTQHFAGIEGIALGSVDWGDYDADGDLDILMSGKGTGCGAIVSGIYRNDGDFFLKIADGFTAAIRSSVRWADYDNDGDLDFIVTGTDYDGFPFTKMYRNEVGSNLFVTNTIPVEPMDINANVNGSTVSIYDSFGKHVTSIQTFGATRIDLNTLHDGLYFLSADNGSRKVMHKFLKK